MPVSREFITLLDRTEKAELSNFKADFSMKHNQGPRSITERVKAKFENYALIQSNERAFMYLHFVL